MQIPVELQLVMWTLLDQIEVDADYLQVFELIEKDGFQHIIHSQEYPVWKTEHRVLGIQPVTAKVYIILEPGLETMILAEDY